MEVANFSTQNHKNVRMHASPGEQNSSVCRLIGVGFTCMQWGHACPAQPTAARRETTPHPAAQRKTKHAATTTADWGPPLLRKRATTRP